MRIIVHQPARQQASVLVTALILAVILGVTLGGYLSWVRTQNVLVAESQAWNAALAHAEAGIEEGMAQINVNFGTNYSSSAATNWSGGPMAGRYGPRTFSFTNGSYSAIIIPANPGPTIISTGYAVVPLVGRQIARTVEVHTQTTPAFGYGVSVIQNVVLSGNNVMVDSYDSSDPAHSSAGLYNPLTRKAGGDVVSTDGLMNVGTANIYGHLRTAPWGTVSIQHMNGRVGDLPQNLLGNSWDQRGIQPGWYANDLNLNFPEVGEPFAEATASFPSLNVSSNTYVLTSNDYLVKGDLELLNGQTLYAMGNARLWVQGNFRGRNGSPGSYIGMASNSSLSLYVGTLTGPPVGAEIFNVNSYGNATNFNYYGLPSNVSMTWSGNQTYLGTVYAPEADLTLNGGGNTSTNDFQGACVARSLTMNGHFNFHFDESLKAHGLQSGYVASYWREL